MSAANTSPSVKSIHSAPWSISRRRRMSASQAGSSDSTPASAADHDETRCGANTIHASAISHHTTAAARTIDLPSGVSVTYHTSGIIIPRNATYNARSATPDTRRNADHSQAPASTNTVSSTSVATGGNSNTMAM